MQIREIMTKSVRGVAPELDAEEAWQYMHQSHVRHLVVIKQGKVLGVVSDRDLGGELGKRLRKDYSVRELMTPHAIALEPETDVRDAAKILRDLVIGCVPVMEGDQLLGIVTTSDLLNVVAAS